jgi:hypothetical protein
VSIWGLELGKIWVNVSRSETRLWAKFAAFHHLLEGLL